MNKTFNIYCDESTHLPSDGHPYMILAYVRVPYNQIDELKESIKDIKAKYAFTGESSNGRMSIRPLLKCTPN